VVEADRSRHFLESRESPGDKARGPHRVARIAGTGRGFVHCAVGLKKFVQVHLTRIILQSHLPRARPCDSGLISEQPRPRNAKTPLKITERILRDADIDAQVDAVAKAQTFSFSRPL
jgi:hypothetical protein